ncbi:FimV N-terminal domain-containing protein [Mariprofundus ferrinatatus]|uniref:FimV N-terminal domain-containing protein n=1 Tax=Mariprofundus ferrinatatus TaxID=1921087 RepID=A0A2K8L4Y2_9PROT|nr:FimV/HubP family polar landmark protein [Mariprofundus ferrinatatus]ATX82172.1 FimV N-terminal domain-containing protein [Mariprofundus ferrinatatus]
MNRVGHIFRLVWFGLALYLFTGVTFAASLEKIEVNSRLGEPFYAEVPLQLEESELVSKVFVEIAAASDYRIFEVYRDAAVNGIRAEVTSDSRGARVKLSSSNAIRAPFFNLIVKIRHGRVAHFKKYPVFLETPKNVVQAAEKAPLPAVKVETADDSVSSAAVVAVEDVPVEEIKKVEYFEGWARTSRYGPIVRGDMLSTVVHRLRVDKRYTLSQISVALFEKNKAKFDKENMNLLLSGSYLDVPTAAEVERLSTSEAYKVFKEHDKQFQELKNQPRYAAEAEAQRTRYSKRVSVGQVADGVASAPVAAPAAAVDEKSEPVVPARDKVDVTVSGEVAPVAADNLIPEGGESSQSAILSELSMQNEILQQKLAESEKRIEALSQKVDQAGAAASDAKVERLEILVSRLQEELVQARAQASQSGGLDWIVWVLIGLVVILLVVVVLLMRREPAHPSEAAAVSKASEPVEHEMSSEMEEPSVTDVSETEEGHGEAAPVNEGGDKADVFNLSEDLTETDTAEMVMLDSTTLEGDTHTDYLSEVDVYIRYGMEEEALQQLELALRASPSNVEAHIRKAELLHTRGDTDGFNAAKDAAMAALTGAALAQFNATITGLTSAESELDTYDFSSGEASSQESSSEEGAEGFDSSETAGAEEGPVLDYDISYLDSPEDEVAETDEPEVETSQAEPASEADKQDDELDWLHAAPFEDEAAETGEPEVETSQAEPASEADKQDDELDWLHAAPFEDEAAETGEPEVETSQAEPASEADKQDDELDWLHAAPFEDEAEHDSEGNEDDEAITLNVMDDENSEIEAILDEFEDDSSKEISLEGDSINMERTAEELPESEGTIEIESDTGIGEELGNLIEDFSSDQEEPDELSESSETKAEQDADELEKELTATQHLDNLLGAFDSEDDFDFSRDNELISFDVDEDLQAESKPEEDDDEFGATQHLDSFISGFSGNEEGSDLIEFEESSALNGAEDISSEDQDSTQQFENNSALLTDQEGEPEADRSAGGERVDHDATQELDQLLSQFGDEDEDKDKKP